NRVPVVRRPVRELEPVAIRCRRIPFFRETPELGWRSAVRPADLTVESPQAAEAGGIRHLMERQRRLVEKLLREVDSAREGDLERGRAQVLDEEAAEMTRGHAQSICEVIDVAVLELAGAAQRAVPDQPERARNEARRAEPGRRPRRRLGAAP